VRYDKSHASRGGPESAAVETKRPHVFGKRLGHIDDDVVFCREPSGGVRSKVCEQHSNAPFVAWALNDLVKLNQGGRNRVLFTRRKVDEGSPVTVPAIQPPRLPVSGVVVISTEQLQANPRLQR
jgi:hypothetical protein